MTVDVRAYIFKEGKQSIVIKSLDELNDLNLIAMKESTNMMYKLTIVLRANNIEFVRESPYRIVINDSHITEKMRETITRRMEIGVHRILKSLNSNKYVRRSAAK